MDSLFEACRGYILSNVESGRHTESCAHPAITISREAGSGALEIAQEAIKLLQKETRADWAVFDRDLVERVLEDHDLPKRLAQFMPEDATPEARSAFEEMLGLHPPTSALVEHTAETVRRLAQIGNVILIGRGANVITARLPHVLHVRFVAPLENRVANCGRLYKMDAHEAAEFIRKTDRARARYVDSHFNAPIDDPLLYHLVINTGHLKPEEAAHLIARAALDHAALCAKHR